MSGFLNPIAWLRKLRANTLRPRPVRKFWEFADEEVTVPVGLAS